MGDKVLVIISTGDKDAAKTGVMWSMRCLQEGWMDEVKVIFFGPGERVLIENADVQSMVSQINEAEKVLACKFLADQEGTTDKIESLGVDVVYVGQVIADHIKDGFTPMVW